MANGRVTGDRHLGRLGVEPQSIIVLALAATACASPAPSPTPGATPPVARRTVIPPELRGQKPVDFQLERTESGLVVRTDQTPLRTVPVAEMATGGAAIAATGLAELEHLPLRAVPRVLPDGRLRLDDITLQAVADWREVKALFPPVRAQELNQAQARLEASVQDLLRGGQMGIDATDVVLQSLEQVQVTAVDEYQQLVAANAPLDNDRRRGLVKVLASGEEARDELQERKAYYGRDDRYLPAIYQQIFEASRAAVGIEIGGKQGPMCSGALVGEGVVLTALHCLENASTAADVAVVFDYTGGPDDTRLAVDRWIESRPVPAAPTPLPDAAVPRLDYAFLLLKTEPGLKMAERWRIACLQSAQVSRDDPIYVVGHPSGSVKLVADNSYVYFPFWAREKEFYRIMAKIEGEPGDDGVRQQKLDEFRKSYRPRTIAGGKTEYHYYRASWGGQPTFGIDSDTFGGNSGSPVFQRRAAGTALVGLFYAGRKDSQQSLLPGWSAHEGVIPASEIIAEIDQVLPDWKDRGICLK